MHIVTNYQDKKKWNRFVAKYSNPASFLQSWEWGEFNQKILGNQIQRWAVMDNDNLKITFMLIKKFLPNGRFYYYCPRGLIYQKAYADQRIKTYIILLKKIKLDLKEAVFIRLVPPYSFKDYMFGFIQRLGFIKPKILIHTKEPGKTLVLDLTKNEAELLKDMHHKTRYNIHLAIRRGVTIRSTTPVSLAKDIDIFYNLTQITGKRDKISVYHKDYYTKLINYFFDSQSDLKLKLYIAEFKNKPLAAIMVFYFGNTATYLHGASNNRNRNLMPNYLLQWQAIQDAQKNGLTIYDFWGISEKNKHWAGITRFKKGFSGQVITFLGSWDYVLDRRWYNLFNLMKIIRRALP